MIARFGDASLAAHQIAFQLWIFLAFVLDAIAIAGQVIVGRGLGAGDTERAWEASVRMIWLSVSAGVVFGAVMLALQGVLPYAFTSDELVVVAAQEIRVLFALMQPLNGAVFALDGILIGASDGRFLMWSMVAAFAVCAVGCLAALAFDWGIVGVWASLFLLICVRLGAVPRRAAAGSSPAGPRPGPVAPPRRAGSAASRRSAPAGGPTPYCSTGLRSASDAPGTARRNDPAQSQRYQRSQRIHALTRAASRLRKRWPW